MTSLFARNERLLWRTRFSTTEMPSQFLTQHNTIKSWQFSLFSLKLSLQSTHVHAPIETALAQSADCTATVQSADCARFPDCMEHIYFKKRTVKVVPSLHTIPAWPYANEIQCLYRKIKINCHSNPSDSNTYTSDSWTKSIFSNTHQGQINSWNILMWNTVSLQVNKDKLSWTFQWLKAVHLSPIFPAGGVLVTATIASSI